MGSEAIKFEKLEILLFISKNSYIAAKNLKCFIKVFNKLYFGLSKKYFRISSLNATFNIVTVNFNLKP